MSLDKFTDVLSQFLQFLMGGKCASADNDNKAKAASDAGALACRQKKKKTNGPKRRCNGQLGKILVLVGGTFFFWVLHCIFILC